MVKKISVVVLTKNEEENIIDCIESLKSFDEIIVIDDYSTDKTPEILKKLSEDNEKIKLFKRELDQDFSSQRKFGIEKAKNDWIFFVDADERVTKELENEISDVFEIDDDKFSGFLIRRIDFMWGRQLSHGETGHIRLLRLFNKHDGKLIGKVHESWETKKMVGRFGSPILHYPHPTISEFLTEINFYTDLRAQELFTAKKKASFFSVILYPKAKFIKNYFIKLGFLDGLPGLIHALLMSFHSFLVRGKLWQLSQKS